MSSFVRSVRRSLPDGLDISHVGGKHPYTVVFIESGRPLRDECGKRVLVPTTPGDWRARRNFEARLRRAIKTSLEVEQ